MIPLETFICVFVLIRLDLINCAVTVFPVKIGENLHLDIGREVREWRRIRNGTEEKITPCIGNERKNCNVWIGKNFLPSGDGREHMYVNGTLVIDNFQNTDAGDYYSDDELERIHYTTDGQIWKLAKSRISVFPVE